MKALLGFLAAMTLAGCQTPAPGQVSVSMGADSEGRPTAGVMINDRGPFEMVIDTGGQIMGLEQGLIDQLNLASSQTQNLHGAAGTVSATVYQLSSASLGGILRTDVKAIQMPHGGATGAHDGVFGMDAFAGQRLEFDYEHRLLKIDTANARTVPSGFVAVPARFAIGTFTIVPVLVNGVQADAMVDTGARHSIANPLLMRALGYAEGDSRLTRRQGHGGATNQAAVMLSGGEAILRVGDVQMGEIAVSFSDLPVFSPLGLSDRPAIILGADVWRRLKAMAVDYERQELQLRP